MALPAAAQAHLLGEGLIDEGGASRRPRAGWCRGCGLVVTVAITDSGFTVKAWPVPTTAWGELQALMAGLRTYIALPADLLYRDDFRVRGNHPDRERVLVEHRCGDPPPPPNPVHAPVKRMHSYTGNEEPPF